MKRNKYILLSVPAVALCAAMLAFAPHRVSADEKDTLNASDVKFIKKQAASGMAEVKLAELGKQKAERADVKAFAETLVTDHTKANTELADLAKKKGVETSQVVDPSDASTFQKMEKYSGADFDKKFLSEMISDHKKCISAFEDAAKDARDGDLKTWVNNALPTLKSHLDKAKELDSK